MILYPKLYLALTFTRSSFFTKRERTWMGVAPPAPSRPHECDRASRQKPADSLERSVSNVVRFDLFKSTVDLPG